MQRTLVQTGLLVLDLRKGRGQFFRVLAHADALAAAALGRLEHDGVLDPFRGR
jgi:hypothetical protein